MNSPPHDVCALPCCCDSYYVSFTVQSADRHYNVGPPRGMKIQRQPNFLVTVINPGVFHEHFLVFVEETVHVLFL